MVRRTKNCRCKVFLILFLSLMLISILIAKKITRAEYSVFADEAKVELVEFDGFEENSIIIVLEESISERNRIHEKDFFEGIEIETIKDLTWREDNIEENKKFIKFYKSI